MQTKKKLHPSLQAICNIIIGLHDHSGYIINFTHKLGAGKGDRQSQFGAEVQIN